jgi:hypothetical protein
VNAFRHWSLAYEILKGAFADASLRTVRGRVSEFENTPTILPGGACMHTRRSSFVGTLTPVLERTANIQGWSIPRYVARRCNFSCKVVVEEIHDCATEGALWVCELA